MQAAAPLRDAFLAAFRYHPTGVAIVSGDMGDGPAALTVSSLISISAAPPMVAFSLSQASSSGRALARADTVVVHFVRRANRELARLCATTGSDRFGPQVRWERLATGEPYYPEIEVRFRAVIRGRLDAPGACVVTAEFLSASVMPREPSPEELMVYADRAWHGLRPLGDADGTPVLLWAADSATF